MERVYTFAELEGKERVPPFELCAAFRDHAEEGAHINAVAVNALIDRTRLAQPDIDELFACVKKALAILGGNSNPAARGGVEYEIGQYRQVLEHLKTKI